ncbi:MAG: O-antigen ligase family protein [Bacillota bacterium]
MIKAVRKKFVRISEKADRFFYSEIYIALITAIGITGFLFSLEIYAIYAIAALTCINWILCKDIMPSFLSVAIIAMTPLARYAEDAYFQSGIYLIFFVVPSFILHMVLHPPKFKPNKFLFTTLAVAISVTLGGLFSTNIQEYFSMPALYYIFGLGFGMVFIYIVIQSDVPYNKARIAEYFAKMMVGIGVMGIVMIFSHYIINGELIDARFGAFKSMMQWKNNLSNNLLLSMPFAFYLAAKGKNSVLYLIIGLLQYMAIMLSFSRGGIVFSTIVFPIALVSTFIMAKKDRLNFLIIIAILGGLVYLAFQSISSSLWERVLNIVEIREGEARINLYKLAWENFLKYPIFGRGLAYDGGMYYRPEVWCIYWYHSTIFQILASLGIIGLLAYGYQEIVRIFTLIKVRSRFNLFALLSLIGFAGYSMVNVGYFVPLPFVAMLVHMFIVVDRYNNILIENPILMEKEKILL